MKLFAGLKDRITVIREKKRRMVNWLLENNEDYFTCYYPGNQGFVTKWLIRLVTANLSIDDSSLDRISGFASDDIIVYANKHKTKYNFIFYHNRLKELGLPFPEIGFDYRFILILPIKRLFQMLITHLDFFFHHFRFRN